jgi:hypothetical protein
MHIPGAPAISQSGETRDLDEGICLRPSAPTGTKTGGANGNEGIGPNSAGALYVAEPSSGYVSKSLSRGRLGYMSMPLRPDGRRSGLRRSTPLRLQPKIDQSLSGHSLFACLLTDLEQQILRDRTVDLARGQIYLNLDRLHDLLIVHRAMSVPKLRELLQCPKVLRQNIFRRRSPVLAWRSFFAHRSIVAPASEAVNESPEGDNQSDNPITTTIKPRHGITRLR